MRYSAARRRTKTPPDAGYFSRVFRQHMSLTPLAYRRKIEHEKQAVETRPKTICGNRDDYSAA